MPTATFHKINQFVEDVGRKVHNLNADTIKVYLSNTAPTPSSSKVRADVAEISAANGYSAGGGTVGSTAYSQSGGIGTLTGNDVVFTASGGSFGPYQYAILYNDTPTSPADPLLGYWDYGSPISTNDGETFTVDIGASIITLT